MEKSLAPLIIFDFVNTVSQSRCLTAYYTGSICDIQVFLLTCMPCFANIFPPHTSYTHAFKVSHTDYYMLCHSLSGLQIILPNCVAIILSWFYLVEGLTGASLMVSTLPMYPSFFLV